MINVETTDGRVLINISQDPKRFELIEHKLNRLLDAVEVLTSICVSIDQKKPVKIVDTNNISSILNLCLLINGHLETDVLARIRELNKMGRTSQKIAKEAQKEIRSLKTAVAAAGRKKK